MFALSKDDWQVECSNEVEFQFPKKLAGLNLVQLRAQKVNLRDMSILRTILREKCRLVRKKVAVMNVSLLHFVEL